MGMGLETEQYSKLVMGRAQGRFYLWEESLSTNSNKPAAMYDNIECLHTLLWAIHTVIVHVSAYFKRSNCCGSVCLALCFSVECAKRGW